MVAGSKGMSISYANCGILLQERKWSDSKCEKCNGDDDEEEGGVKFLVAEFIGSRHRVLVLFQTLPKELKHERFVGSFTCHSTIPKKGNEKWYKRNEKYEPTINKLLLVCCAVVVSQNCEKEYGAPLKHREHAGAGEILTGVGDLVRKYYSPSL